MEAVTETILLERDLGEKITRFDIHQIIQHAGLMVSFIVLVATGLPLKFHDAAISQWWVGVWGGIDAVRSAHHFFCLGNGHCLHLSFSLYRLFNPCP